LVRKDVATASKLRRLDDLGKYGSSGGGQFKLASAEFVERPDAPAAFRKPR
jgi:osmoprotectant transport system substrate-binding protein